MTRRLLVVFALLIGLSAVAPSAQRPFNGGENPCFPDNSWWFCQLH